MQEIFIVPLFVPISIASSNAMTHRRFEHHRLA